MTLISRLVFAKNNKSLNQLNSEIIQIHEISIIIPVKNNQIGIDKYLDNFFNTQNLATFPKEIIIVDNNSNPSIKISNRHKGSGLITLVSCSKQGPAAARNFGASKATGRWLLFNDSDCIPTESYLTGYLSADNGAIAYAGNVKSAGKDPVSKYYETQEILIPMKTYDENGFFMPQYLITANTLVWTESFRKIHGFNEDITFAGGEDIDFGLRLSQVGKLSYAFDSIVLHDFSDGLFGFCNRFKRYGKGNKFIEYLWQTNMRPKLFRPNRKTVLNEIFAKLQFFCLLYGYISVNPISQKTASLIDEVNC